MEYSEDNFRSLQEELEKTNQGLLHLTIELEKAKEELIKKNLELQRVNNELKFVEITSHTLKEPLRSISGFIQLLAKKYSDKLDDEAKEYISFAIDGTKRMYEILGDLESYLDIFLRGGSFVEMDMNEILELLLKMNHLEIKKANAEITHEQLPIIKGDPNQISQLFWNLIDNALKFKREKISHIHVSIKQDEIFWIFSISDNGIGIEPQYFERIFKLFYTIHGRTYSGTGIGLPICKVIVERHGGRIWLESKLNQGSTFSFSIPKILT